MGSDPLNDRELRPSQFPPPYLLDGRYLAVDRLAQGDTSNVFSGTDTWSGEQVAIRVLRGDRMDRERAFRRMAERMFGLTSARLARAIHTGDDRKGRPYLVTEMLVGRGLETLGKVRWEVACELGRHAALALAEIHVNGLHHGAVRASRFFVAASAEGGSRVKLLDLGTGERGTTAQKDVHDLTLIVHRLLTGMPPLPAKARASGLGSTIAGAPPEVSESMSAWLAAADHGTELLASAMATKLKALVDPQSEEQPRATSPSLTTEIVLPKLSRTVLPAMDDDDDY